MENLPQFLIADSSEQADVIYVIHTAYPRFCLDVTNEHIHWMETFEEEDAEELATTTTALVEEALAFFDREMENI
jgi:hypothetical protein